MREIVRYQIETRHPMTGFWEVQREIMCNYVRESVKRRFLGFTWFKSEITNKDEAELCCRKEAMVCRLSYEREYKDVRVTVTGTVEGYVYKDIVWENGEWKDC
jgi:hypothetical protein